MPAFPKSFLSIDNEIERIRSHYQADLQKDCLIIGNGPSAMSPSLTTAEAKTHFLIRMNWFFLENEMTYGDQVDAFFWSVDNRGLRNALELNDAINRYKISGVFQPHNSSDDREIRARESKEPRLPEFDHWAVIATCPELARTMMSRPLPTQGMQAIAFAAILGFKRIRLAGVDMYGSPEKRYSWTVSEGAQRFLKEKDIKPGYEPHHDIDRDLRFLETVRAKYDFELFPVSDMEVLDSAGVFDGRFSIARKAPAEKRIFDSFAEKKFAYVTHVEGRYALGALALARSLERTSPHKLIVLYSDEYAPHYLGHLPNVELRYVNKIANPSTKGQGRFANTYTKLRAFEIKGYDRLTFVDSDAVVLKGVDDLFEGDGFCAAPDLGLAPVPAVKTFNSGVFSFSPKDIDFADMLNASMSFDSDDGGDQGFLNRYFDGQVTYLPAAYNTLKRALVYHPELISINDVKVLHFVGAVKPWDTIGRFESEYLAMNKYWVEQLTADDWVRLYFANVTFASKRIDKQAFENIQKRYAEESECTKERLDEMFPERKPKFGECLEAARSAAAVGNFSASIYLYGRALIENNTSTNAMIELAKVYKAIGDKESALSVLERAKVLRPDREDIARQITDVEQVGGA